MTGMPEAALAREMALEFACIALVVNRAAGLTEELITMESMEKIMHEGMQKIRQLIATCCAQNKV
jgi:5'-methylthioinosine phosphorylase